mgnify:CR=1 FL=1
MQLIHKIIKWFERQHQNDLEAYVEARNPQSEADVERLITEYNQRYRKYYV